MSKWLRVQERNFTFYIEHFTLKIYVKRIFSLSILFLSLCSFSYSQNEQTSKRTNQQTNEPPFLEKLFPLFPPKFFEAELRLKGFIRSDKFLQIKKTNGELASVDSIFVRAKILTNKNLSLALLLSTLATNDHRVIYFQLPVFNLKFPFPLTFETEEEFQKRFENLPRYFLSPKVDNRDKLQHFFASAFLSYTFESIEIASRFGIFVEEGENAFIEGGTYDVDDLKMNKLGAVFGAEIQINSQLIPSEYLQKKNK